MRETFLRCSKKQESQKSFMCEHLEPWPFLGVQCRIWTQHPFAGALVLYCPEEGQTLGWAHPPQPLQVWVEFGAGIAREWTLWDILLLIIRVKHWECPHTSDSMGTLLTWALLPHLRFISAS